jgi:hypothetical protein
MTALERDEEFSKVDKYDEDVFQNRKSSLRKALRINQLFDLVIGEYKKNESLYLKYWRHCWRLSCVADQSFATRYGVHNMLFKGCILGQGHDEMVKEFAPLFDSYKVYGCM